MGVKVCEICSERAAKYVCQRCGRMVCKECLEPRAWFCSECCVRVKQEASLFETISWSIPLNLFLFGFFLIFVGTILVMVAMVLSGTPATFGAVVFVGPIPIVLGAGPNFLWAIALAVVITILGTVLFIIWRKRG